MRHLIDDFFLIVLARICSENIESGKEFVKYVAKKQGNYEFV